MINWATIGVDTGRFTLHEDGQITWQENKTNPLPGDAVAKIIKGDDVLSPKAELFVDESRATELDAHASEAVNTWLNTHVRTVLAPLFNILDTSESVLDGVAKDIGQHVYDNLGVIHRSEIEKFVKDLTPELRTGLRKKRIKMGPILVFMPELVKPAAINLRALLSGLWNGQSLPMERPADGRVSVAVDPENVHRNYYRSIGYPIFGKLAIRIDMLDRVVTDIYDSSKDFKFQAQHKYMEWLGCGEEDLYAVLSSMGFRKIEVKENAAEEKTGESADEQSPEVSETEEKVAKPELATFLLKKGRISDRPVSKFKNSKTDKKSLSKKKKPVTKKNAASHYSAKPKENEVDSDSPFAILQKLKT